jgi:hypothetical protein
MEGILSAEYNQESLPLSTPTPQRAKGVLFRRSHSDLALSLAMEEGRDAQMETLDEERPFMGLDEEDSEKPIRPKPEVETIFGMDKRPFYPLALFLSSFLGAMCVLHVQCALWHDVFGGAAIFHFVFSLLYVATLGCMAYAALCDPGQISKQWQPGDPLPRRSHKTWLYRRPVLRFDHYCRWLTNVIGLRNHREFMVMVGGLTAISLLSIVVDSLLLTAGLFRAMGFSRILVTFHLAYSLGVGKYAGQIFRLHVGFVSRNELAKEWKNDDYYVLRYDDGSEIPVNDLTSEEYNKYEDDFEYDSTRNPWDNGLEENCMRFWWNPRCGVEQLGEF